MEYYDYSDRENMNQWKKKQKFILGTWFYSQWSKNKHFIPHMIRVTILLSKIAPLKIFYPCIDDNFPFLIDYIYSD